jgi:hypothetical protein
MVRGPAGVRGRRAKPHDYEDDRISNGGRNETRALTLMPTLRVNSGTERVIDGASRVLFLPLSKRGMTR